MAGLKSRDLAGLKKGDWRKRVIGRAVRRGTVMAVTWIADALDMGDPKRAAKLLQSDPDSAWGPEWRKAKRLMVELRKVP